MFTSIVIKTILFFADFSSYKIVYYPLKYLVYKPISFFVFSKKKINYIEPCVVTIHRHDHDWDIISLN
jgi:hypothetical protein